MDAFLAVVRAELGLHIDDADEMRIGYDSLQIGRVKDVIALSRLNITAGWQNLGLCNFPAAVSSLDNFILKYKAAMCPILIKLRAHSLTNADWLCLMLSRPPPWTQISRPAAKRIQRRQGEGGNELFHNRGLLNLSGGLRPGCRPA